MLVLYVCCFFFFPTTTAKKLTNNLLWYILAVRLFEEGTRKFIGYLGTPDGPASFPASRNRILDDDQKTAFTTIVWKGGAVFADRTGTTPVKVDPGRYQVMVAAQRKQTQGNFPVDFEVQQVAVITF